MQIKVGLSFTSKGDVTNGHYDGGHTGCDLQSPSSSASQCLVGTIAGDRCFRKQVGGIRCFVIILFLFCHLGNDKRFHGLGRHGHMFCLGSQTQHNLTRSRAGFMPMLLAFLGEGFLLLGIKSVVLLLFGVIMVFNNPTTTSRSSLTFTVGPTCLCNSEG
jgi:hypothetical protein